MAASLLFRAVGLGLAIVAGTGGILEGTVRAEEATPQQEQAARKLTAAEKAAMPLHREYGSAVERRWRAILDEEGWREGENPGDRYVSSGSAIVTITKGRPGWIEARRVAFEIARARAKASMVAHLAQEVQATGETRLFENAVFGQGSLREVEQLGQAARIVRKLGDLTEATLDKALRELDPDYDPDRYKALSREEKALRLEESFRRKVLRTAARVVGGATTYAVLEGPTQDGLNHEILVGLIWSPNTARLATTIDNPEQAMPPQEAGQRVEELLPKTVGEAVASFGTKLFFNEKGEHAILAFGQAEPAAVQGPDRELAIRAALERAETLATAEIASFVKENVTLRDEVQSEALTRIYADLVERGVRIDTEQVQEIRTATGTLALTGVETVWRQAIKHPETDQDIAIAAVLWSPSGHRSAKAMERAMERAERPIREGPATAVSEGQADARGPGGMTFERPRGPRNAY